VSFAQEETAFDKIIAESPEMKELLALAYRIASYDSTVLICGESGVGKEVVANYIHHHSARSQEPYIKVNCTAIPESLLESHFFGYEPGSFTGALHKGKAGIFEAANNGTIFLDEIGDLPFSLQGKLLRVLQEGEVMRIGGTKLRHVNVRIIAATNKNLPSLVNKNLFREDLYYRLNVIPLLIPPLRQRREDIISLLNHYKKKYETKFHINKRFAPEVYDLLLNYNWPGNVRELRNTIERLFVITEPGTTITPSVLTNGNFINTQKAEVAGTYMVLHDVGPLKDAVAELEKLIIELAFQKYGSVQKVAQVLGINPSTLWRKKKVKKIYIRNAINRVLNPGLFFKLC